MEYFLFFLIAGTSIGAILYFVIEDIKMKKEIQDRRKQQEEKEKQ